MTADISSVEETLYTKLVRKYIYGKKFRKKKITLNRFFFNRSISTDSGGGKHNDISGPLFPHVWNWEVKLGSLASWYLLQVELSLLFWHACRWESHHPSIHPFRHFSLSALCMHSIVLSTKYRLGIKQIKHKYIIRFRVSIKMMVMMVMMVFKNY